MISKWLTAEYSVPRHEEHLREEGRTEGREEQAKFTNSQMKSSGMTIDQRSKMLGLPADILSSWDKESVNN